MNIKQLFQKLKRISQIRDYLQGTILQWLYDNHRKYIPKYIVEQYHYRLNIMNRSCLMNGQCIKCGCSTPALQFAFISCEGNCYPKLMNPYKWYKFKKEHPFVLRLLNNFLNE